MLTDDKEISSASYWNSLYEGKRNNAKQDASNNVRPPNAFDRFNWVLPFIEGPNVLGVGSGHAVIESRLKAANPLWWIVASDQADAALKVTKFRPFNIFSCYEIPFGKKEFNTIVATQCLEYLEDIPKFLNEASRVAEYLVCTIPIGSMSKWSQLYEFTEENFLPIIGPFGKVLGCEWQGDLFLVKLKFHE